MRIKKLYKIFYTEYEGGFLIEKTINKKSMHQLLLDIENISIVDWKLTTREKDIKRTVKFFGINIFSKKLFATKVHSIFIPEELNLEVSLSDNYRRWDSINGWNDMDDDNIESLTKAVLANANSNKEPKQE